MEADIVAIGNLDSIAYFRLLGFETYECREGNLTQDQLDDIRRRHFKIILLTEEVFKNYGHIIRHSKDRLFPVVSIIPDLRSALWKEQIPSPGARALEEIRAAIIKAVGQNIVPR